MGGADCEVSSPSEGVSTVIVSSNVHTCPLLRNIPQICYSAQTGQHLPLQGSCCPVCASMHACMHACIHVYVGMYVCRYVCMCVHKQCVWCSADPVTMRTHVYRLMLCVSVCTWVAK